MRRIVFGLIGMACGLATGCAMLDDGKESVAATANAMKPRDHDYRDDANDGDTYLDPWKGVGEEGRASEAKEHDFDALTKHVESPKAQAIERNLGYGY